MGNPSKLSINLRISQAHKNLRHSYIKKECIGVLDDYCCLFLFATDANVETMYYVFHLKVGDGFHMM